MCRHLKRRDRGAKRHANSQVALGEAGADPISVSVTGASSLNINNYQSSFLSLSGTRWACLRAHSPASLEVEVSSRGRALVGLDAGPAAPFG